MASNLQPNDTQPNQNTQHETQEETSQQINWKKFREKQEIERREKEESQRLAAQKTKEAEALKAALEAIVNKPSTNSVDNRNQYEEESEDERIQKKIDSILQSREKQYEEERRVREQNELPIKLRNDHPDFETVCSHENMDYLKYHYPEVASAFKYAPDNYETWSSVYKAIKRFVPNTDGKKDQRKIEENLGKPQSMSRPGSTPTGDGAPQYLDEKRKADNWRRMQMVRKGVS